MRLCSQIIMRNFLFSVFRLFKNRSKVKNFPKDFIEIFSSAPKKFIKLNFMRKNFVIESLFGLIVAEGNVKGKFIRSRNEIFANFHKIQRGKMSKMGRQVQLPVILLYWNFLFTLSVLSLPQFKGIFNIAQKVIKTLFD